ncbi:MAG TPA: hypothetical protein VF950_28275 [Planctomycetota bacterium]
MRKIAVVLLCVAALGACRRREERPVSKENAADIPREVALQKLKELLPTADSVSCTNPKDSYKASEIKDWGVRSEGLRIAPIKEKDPAFTVNFADISQVRLDKLGKYFQVRVFAPPQTDASKDLMAFTWRTEEAPLRVVELLESLRLRK